METSAIKRNIRKYNDYLATSGYAVIAFFAWNFLKGLFYLLWLVPNTDMEIKLIILLVYFIIYIGEIIVCTLTGFLAIRESRKDNTKKRSVFLLILSFIIFIFGLGFTVFDIYYLFVIKEANITVIIGTITDILFTLFAFQMVFSLIKIRKLRKVIINE